MLDILTLLLLRVVILFAGAIICWLGGAKSLSFISKTKSSNIINFLKLLTYSVVLLGLTMFMIAIGNLLVYFSPNTGSYIFLVAAGLVGIASIFAFIYSFFKIHGYVVMK